jgi:hypothetical protein
MYHVLFVICIYIPISCIAFGIKYYTEEQKDTLLSLFGYYDGVNDTQVTHVNEATQTDEIIESLKAHKKP